VPDEPVLQLWRQNIEAATREGRFEPRADILVLDGIRATPTRRGMLSESLDVRLVLYFSVPT